MLLPIEPARSRCQNCGYENPPDARFCGLCGREISAPAATQTPAAGPPGPPPPAGSRPWWRGPAGLGLALLALAAVTGGTLLATGTLSSARAPRPHGGTGPSRSIAATHATTSSALASTPTTTTSTQTTPTTPTTTSTTRAAPSATGPAAIIRQHLDDINEGHYLQAFSLMTPTYQAQNPSWPSVRATADPGIEVISVGSPQFPSSGTAHVTVDFYARDRHSVSGSSTQCRQFQGTVELVSVGGKWRYDPSASGLTGTLVPASNPNCPV
jgi:hypothetical protein